MKMFRGVTVSAALLACIAPHSFASAFPHTGVAQLSAGGYHTCAVLADHHVVCWGAETVGTPNLIQGITTAVSVTSGYGFACALLLDHTVQCWGDNSQGQLGDGTSTSRSYPAPTESLFGDVTDISVGEDHGCALRSDHVVYCWGSNSKGQLGNGALPVGPGVYSPHPIYVADYSAATGSVLYFASDIRAGGSHTCARSDGTAATYCWGSNSFGELGLGYTSFFGYAKQPTNAVTVPDSHGVPVHLGMQANSLSLGALHSCGLVPDDGPSRTNVNSIACWGSNENGAIGSAIGDHASNPVAVMTSAAGTKLYDIQKLAAGNDFTCVLQLTGSIQCWGQNNFGQLGTPFGGSSSQWPVIARLTSDFTDISAGAAHVCASGANGVVCWGSNLLGQRGNGSIDASTHYDAGTANVDAPIFTDNFDDN
jgi:alpha-tubulin suppressor-like RCC1 family protein